MAKKRANGEGSLRRKENGHWEVQIMVGYRPDGSHAKGSEGEDACIP